jgi:hypothetical protein
VSVRIFSFSISAIVNIRHPEKSMYQCTPKRWNCYRDPLMLGLEECAYFATASDITLCTYRSAQIYFLGMHFAFSSRPVVLEKYSVKNEHQAPLLDVCGVESHGRRVKFNQGRKRDTAGSCDRRKGCLGVYVRLLAQGKLGRGMPLQHLLLFFSRKQDPTLA